jgi:hypothetical protein
MSTWLITVILVGLPSGALAGAYYYYNFYKVHAQGAPNSFAGTNGRAVSTSS